MNRVIAKSGAVVAMGLILLSNQGCNTKWLKSGGEGGAESGSSKLPNMSRGGPSGELNGFSRNPSEERLGQGGYSTSMNPSGHRLKIEGHCDERGTTDYNIVLGDKRAKAARSYLAEVGVNPKQLAIVSFGKERPFCFDRDESCYQQNRRGHMLLPTKK
ncbi:MAG: OmpA family protein [Nitrospirae bacterium]|nr:OmpA family protein [Nitrospirota bacterium]